ncbi:MAG: restriction endonuclease subunit S, partial [Thiotrichaceae bacterium]|nr:restriction endonuclease subunit S [Thiotrichaceae bacterium]
MIEKNKKPEIRFKGFGGKWEERKLGECVLIQRGGSPRPIENFITDDKNGINWIKIGDVSIGSRYITKTKEKIIPEGEKYSRKVQKGDLILSNSMSFGRPYIMAIDGCIHDGWLLIRDEKKIFDLEYLLQLLSSNYMLSQYRALASGGVVINLNSELVQSTNIFVPNKKEQTKIGNYFQQLDTLISLHQRKIDKLLNVKKAML